MEVGYVAQIDADAVPRLALADVEWGYVAQVAAGEQAIIVIVVCGSG